MIDGIEILAEHTDYVVPLWLAIVLLVICIAGAVAMIYATVYSILKRDGSTWWAIIIGMLICGGLSCKVISDIKSGPVTYYKVKISEDARLKEFVERYEIVNQDGQIYEIREKEISE